MILIAVIPVTLVLAVAALLAVQIRRLEGYWRDTGIPHESYASYLYTNFVRFRRENVFDVLHEYRRRFGPVYGTYQGLRPLLRIASVDAATEVLRQNFSSLPRRNLDVATGNPLWDRTMFALPYGEWKQVRHLSGAALTNNKLRGIADTLERLSVRLADKMVDAARTSGRLDAFNHAQGLMLDCIAAVVFGLELDALSDPANAFCEHAQNIFAPGLAVQLLTTAPWLIKYVPFLQFPTRKTTKFFQDFTAFMIKEHRQRADDPSRQDADILSLWLREQKNKPDALTDDTIASQAFLFFVAGFETVAATLYYALYFLATHPEAQANAVAEIASSASQSEGTTTTTSRFDYYNRLKYVEACVLETLRLCPTDFVIDRVCVEPCSIAGVQLKPGTAVQIPIPVIQRDSSYFPDPDEFRPERFLDGPSKIDAFLAFGDGPKGCLGKRLALLQITVALSCILTRLHLGRCTETPDQLDWAEGMPFLPLPKKPLIIALDERVPELRR